ncbi:MAG TPA: tetratricopeptide repeat protein [Polyangia bacterium]
MSSGACSDDRLVRARRGELSPDEAGALQAHLATCPFCRLSATVGAAVGPLPPVDDEDEAMAGRLVARQLEADATAAPRLPRIVALPSRAVRWRASRTIAVAASIILIASAASAAYWTVHLKAARRAATERAILAPPPPKTSLRRSPSSPLAEPPPVAPPEVPIVAPPIAPPAAQPLARPVASVDPETLLRDANEARRARHADEAIRGYRALQTRFPTSKEAVLSHLSLGHLRLAQGAYADALAQFEAYLHGDGGTELAEEALLGQARALAALGRADEERTLWQAFESRFPTSEYLWRARQRLRELDRGAAP